MYFTSFVNKNVDKREHTVLAVLEALSDNYSKRAHFNTVVYQIDKMDWVGFEQYGSLFSINAHSDR